MNNELVAYIGALLEQIAPLGGTTLLAALLVCAMAGAAVKTTAFTLVKSMGASNHLASRISFYGMALMFMVCVLASVRYAAQATIL